MAQPKPFKIAVSDETLKWINDRVATARLPPSKDLPDDELWRAWGLPPSAASRLHKYWTTKFDWRRVEKEINQELTQFTLPIIHAQEELTIHFVHHRSSRKDAIPLLFLHGWPGNFLEVRSLIKHLTDPPNATDPAYHVVAPSLPGYGFSSYPSKPCSPMAIADIIHKLMLALGYSRFIIQGGDWGSMVGRLLALQHPDSCRGIHLNMVVAGLPSPIWNPLTLVRVIAAFATGFGVSAFQKQRLDRMKWWRDRESGYQAIQGTKPQTLSYALTDSPFGMLCWLQEKVHYIVGQDFEFPDELAITWAMIYILNGSPGHAEIYKWGQAPDGHQAELVAAFDKRIPQATAFGASIFPDDPVYIPRWWAECKAASNITFWKEHQAGGHFPSVERPAVLAADIREFTNTIDDKVLHELRTSYT